MYAGAFPLEVHQHMLYGVKQYPCVLHCSVVCQCFMCVHEGLTVVAVPVKLRALCHTCGAGAVCWVVQELCPSPTWGCSANAVTYQCTS